MTQKETFRYRMPADLANNVRTLARTNGMEMTELSRRLLAVALMVDNKTVEGGSVILRREDMPEETLGVIGRRSFVQRALDRIEAEVEKKESVFVLKIPSDLIENLKVISVREKLPLNRALEEVFTQAIYIATAQTEPNTQVVFKNPDLSESPFPVALPS